MHELNSVNRATIGYMHQWQQLKTQHQQQHEYNADITSLARFGTTWNNKSSYTNPIELMLVL